MLALPLRSQFNRKPYRTKSYRPRIEWMEPRTLLSAVTWTGGAGDNNWDTPANWSTDSVPGSADDVTINIAADVVHSSDVTDSIHSLTSTEPLTISGGTLSIAAASTIGNTLSINGGTLTGTGDVSVSGLVTLTAGTLSGSGALNANGGMLINPAGRQASIWTAARSTTPPARPRRGPGPSRDAATSRLRTAACSTIWAHSWLTATALTTSRATGDCSVFNNMGTFTATASLRVWDSMYFQRAGRVRRRHRITASWTSTKRYESRRAAFNIESSAGPRPWADFTSSTRPRPSAAAGGLQTRCADGVAGELQLSLVPRTSTSATPSRRLVS